MRAALLALLLPAAASAADYYVDAGAGSDLAAGTSPGAAWRTLAKVSGTVLSAGATVYLKRGETWNETLTLGSTVTVDAYGSGAAPVLDGSFPLGAWTAEGSGVYSQAVAVGAGQGLGNVSEDGVMLAPVDWLGTVAGTFGSAANGTYSFNVTGNVLYIKRASAPTGTYRVGLNLYGVNADGQAGVTVRNLRATRATLQGVQLKACRRCAVSGVTVDNVGGAYIGNNPSAPPAYLYAGNGIDVSNSSSDVLIENASVSQVFDSCLAVETYVSYSTMTRVELRDSRAEKCGFAGVELSGLSNGGTVGSTWTAVSVSRIAVTDAGRGWSGRRYGTEGNGVRVAMDAGAGTMRGVTVSEVSVSGCAGDGAVVRGDLGTIELGRLDVSGCGYGVIVQDAASTSLKLRLTASRVHRNSNWGFAFDAPSAAGFELLGNTFSNNGTINVGVSNQAGTARILNNVFHSGSAMTQLYSNAALAGAEVDYNCWSESAGMAGYAGTAYNGLAAFSAATGFETRGVRGAALSAPSSGGLELTAGSPCRGRGSAAAALAADFRGRPYANPPSMGAHEYVPADSSRLIASEETFAFPNPVRTGTVSLRFMLTRASAVELEIRNSARLRIHRASVDGVIGRNVYRWDASGAANGVYLWSVKAGGETVTKKVLLLK